LRAPLLLNRLADVLPSASLLVLAFDAESEEEAAREGDVALGICDAVRGEDRGAPEAERSVASTARERWTQTPLFAAGAFVEILDVATTWDRAEALCLSIRRAVEDLAFARVRFAHAAPEGCALELALLGLAGGSAAALARSSPDDAEADLEEAQRRRDAALGAALSAAAEEGATLSHHSGVGADRQLLLRRELGEGIRQLRALKKAFDPHGILNPGKLLL
jgi:alkyldihydroxyacetonephosphate synthase